jgi:hypothetical protein
MWGRAVAPYAEWVTRALWSSSARLARESAPPTRLTQRFKREAKGGPPAVLLRKTTLRTSQIGSRGKKTYKNPPEMTFDVISCA